MLLNNRFCVLAFYNRFGSVSRIHGKEIGKALVGRLLELAGGKESIFMYTCVNENAIPFYEKIGMKKSYDVMVYNHIDWTDFVVE